MAALTCIRKCKICSFHKYAKMQISYNRVSNSHTHRLQLLADAYQPLIFFLKIFLNVQVTCNIFKWSHSVSLGDTLRLQLWGQTVLVYPSTSNYFLILIYFHPLTNKKLHLIFKKPNPSGLFFGTFASLLYYHAGPELHCIPPY